MGNECCQGLLEKESEVEAKPQKPVGKLVHSVILCSKCGNHPMESAEAERMRKQGFPTCRQCGTPMSTPGGPKQRLF